MKNKQTFGCNAFGKAIGKYLAISSRKLQNKLDEETAELRKEAANIKKRAAEDVAKINIKMAEDVARLEKEAKHLKRDVEHEMINDHHAFKKLKTENIHR